MTIGVKSRLQRRDVRRAVPSSWRRHRYVISVFALSEPLDLAEDLGRRPERAAEARVPASGQVISRCERR